MEASKQTEQYFKYLKDESLRIYKIAGEARKKGLDPEEYVEVKLAENLAERVIGLISAVAPQLGETNAINRIMELEKQYGALDWRVAFQIALEIAQEKHSEFKDKKEAMEIGIRTGFAYVTLGVVSAPLEGFTNLEIKNRRDGKGEYFCLNYAGPVRAAGGTAAAVSVLIADYVRKHMGYAEYDPDDKEVKRCQAELEDYHEYVANLQYFPSKNESEFLMKHVPVEISGDPSEKYEVSSALLKDLPRIPTNNLRSGYCLIHSACIPLKAPKLWAKLDKWGKEMNMDHWNFLKEFLEIQSQAKTKGKKKKEEAKILPDYTYISDLVGGRPVLGHPMKQGALRLRYGRSRASGFSSQAIHPATMHVTNGFVAIGTQLKVERPGKAAAFSSCDTIEGPVVKLKNGDVKLIETEEEAKEIKDDVLEILYTGDVLINYGDFHDRNHKLVPVGYCQEIWIQELEEAANKIHWTIDPEKISDLIPIDSDKIWALIKRPLKTKTSFEAALEISKALEIPLHPIYTYHWNAISNEELVLLRKWVKTGKKEKDLVIPLKKEKRFLELIGLPHKQKGSESVIIEKGHSEALLHCLSTMLPEAEAEKKIRNSNTTLEAVNELSFVKIKDKSGTFIGSRMGRPEKAKMRKLTGSPHVLFPVGEQGGRLRSFQAAMEAGKLVADIQLFKCECGNKTPFKVCEKCSSKTKLIRHCNICGETEGCDHNSLSYTKATMNVKQLIESLKKNLGTKILPDLIKGVRGTSNKEHVSEHLIKGILRAKHNLSVNKDGTIRYDTSELALTHFKPSEIGTSVEKLKEMGYEKDIHGKPLMDENQVVELKVQDIVLPCSPLSPDEPADEVLFRTANFVDEELEKVYGLKTFYNLKSKEDLVGHLAVGLAPHTSAGIIIRIIGFSKTQGFFAHPYVHAAMRRDCDGDESCISLLMDSFLNFSKKYLPSSRGSTMDAPLVLTSKIIPTEVDDMIFNVDVAWKYPLSLYRAAEEYKPTSTVKIKRIAHALGTEDQYENIGFTHDVSSINHGVLCSAYKLLPSMADKVREQMDVAVKIRAVDQKDVAKLVINKHFIRDTKGNLRKFSLQQFRCVNCNEKYRRPPLIGSCSNCNGKIIFTITEGSIIKYLGYMLDLADKYEIDIYTRQVIELTRTRIEGVFGKEKEVQKGLDSWLSTTA